MDRDKLLRICVFFYALLNVIYYFFPWEPLFYLALANLFYVLAAAVFSLPKISLRVVSGLFAIAVALMLYGGATPLQWLKGLNKNGLLIALFTFGPMLNLPFTYKDYQSELKNVAKLYMRTMIPFNLLIAVPTHIFGALTGFAAFAIMYNLFLDTSKLYDSEDIFIATLGRSYSTGGFWGTSWAGVVLVVSELGIPWYRVILVGMIFTAVSIGINLISIKLKMLKNPGRYPTLAPEADTVVQWSNIFMMLALSLVIVLTTLVVNQTTGWELLAIVPLVSVFFPPLVALIQGKVPEYKEGLKKYFDKSLYKCRTETCLFCAAGFLAAALNISGVGAMIPRLIPTFLIRYPLLLVISLMLLLIIPGQLGVHPVATGTTMVATIVPAAIGLTVPVFAQTIICAWLLSNMMSPFSALNLTLSGLSGKSSFYTGLKLNWRYGVVCILVYSVMILVFGPLLGGL
ncbi:MAG: hypothetical protein VB085_08110 [Peptococcaceae bacterium]|nr:hypothetical protein [Peptococcaceae bacterium]